MAYQVNTSPELKRIAQMQSRDVYSVGVGSMDAVTMRCRREGSKAQLRPLQSAALFEMGDLGGAIVALPVGEGKTLISYLVSRIFDTPTDRVLLLVPAALREKTRRDFAAISMDWIGGCEVESYEKISRDKDFLTRKDPTILIADEAHCLGNYKSGLTRRVKRFIDKTNCVFVAMSGTLASRAFRDWWLLQKWALPAERRPLPDDLYELTEWGEALDEKIPDHMRRKLGALKVFGSDLREVRSRIGQIIAGCKGIITCVNPGHSVPLRIELVRHTLQPAARAALDSLRAKWETPDGEQFSVAVDLWRHAREISNGFYYRYDPPPPLELRELRSAYHRFVRGVLSRSRTIDTEKSACDAYPDAPEIRAWRAVKNQWPKASVSVWLDTSLLEAAVTWARDEDALIWVEHRAVGQAIDALGVPFFSEGGRTAKGLHIYDHKGAACVSVRALGKGLNLQQYSRAVVLNCTPKGSVWEQMIGRLHRSGQTADEVLFIVMIGCEEQEIGFKQALADADYITRITGQKQKLLTAIKR